MRSHALKLNIEDLTIHAFLHISHGPKLSEALHFHSAYELQYVYSGSFLLEIEKNRCEVSQGTVLMIAPKVFHQLIQCDENSERLSIGISLERNKNGGETFEKYQNIFQRLENFWLLETDLPELRMLTEQMLCEKTPITPDREHLFRAYFTAIFIRLSEVMMENGQKDRGEDEREREVIPSRDLSNAIIHFIINGYEREVCVGELAKELGFSVRQIERIIQNQMGTTFSRLLNEYRIRVARRMILHETQMTLEEIGYAVGYRDYHCFLKQFKRYEKTTPSVYRKENRNE